MFVISHQGKKLLNNGDACDESLELKKINYPTMIVMSYQGYNFLNNSDACDESLEFGSTYLIKMSVMSCLCDAYDES